MPLSQTIEIVEEVAGEIVTIEQELPTTEFAVKIDGIQYQPVITNNVEIENSGDHSVPSDQCGNTERHRTTNKGWVIRVSGIVTGNDGREGNLSLQLLRDVIAKADTVTIRSDVISGSFVVSNTVITQDSSLVSIQTQDTEGEEKAFEFQIQLGEEKSN